MKKEIVISPIFYMGNKKKLIAKGLTDLFPKNIDCFYDLFAGSGIVSMNTKAKEFVVNDIDNYLSNLYSVFYFFSTEELLTHINARIDKYGLPRERTKRNQFKDVEKIKEYKRAFTEFRSFYNRTHMPADLLTLMFFSFSQQFRFNKNGEYNMPFGNDCFSEKNEEYIENGCNFFSQDNVFTTKESFDWFSPKIMESNDFVYLDPPYFDTTATYNENNGWTESDENKLYEFCEDLNQHNIKWGMSNVFSNKGKENTHLIEWCKANNWNVYHFENFNYMACGKGNSKADEVFIYNYKMED